MIEVHTSDFEISSARNGSAAARLHAGAVVSIESNANAVTFTGLQRLDQKATTYV